MKLQYVDSKAADEGRVVIVTDPKVSKEVFDCFASAKDAHPLHKNVRCELTEGRVAVLGSFADDFGEFLVRELNSCEAMVARQQQAKKEKEERDRRARRDAASEAARRLGLPIQ